jgi:predicted flap endonuclease-1-like 5' DNA nuclease
MDTLTILLMQARTEAILVVLSLLLVSAIIGFVTAWFYSGFIHRRELKTLAIKSEKLNQQIAIRDEEISDLQKKLIGKKNQLEKQSKELEIIKTLYAAHASDSELYERDDLKMISGIGPFIEERLHAMDITSFEQISKFNQKDIKHTNVALEYFVGRIERDNWIAQARELINEEEKEAALDRIRARKTQIYFNRIGVASQHKADDLTAITGIGGWIEKKLNALDINTFKQIANFNNEDTDLVTETIEYFPGRIERDEWVHQAKELVRFEGKKADLLKKIAEQKDVISTNSSGDVLKHRANNLTLIKGITLWIEERLNTLSIYTFEQISNLSPEDEESISAILKISPTRIRKDNWIGQAKEFTNTKSSSPIHNPIKT